MSDDDYLAGLNSMNDVEYLNGWISIDKDTDNIYTNFTYKYMLKGESVDEILKQLPISEIENFIRKEKMKNLINRTE